MYKYSAMNYKNAEEELISLVKNILGVTKTTPGQVDLNQESTPLTTNQQRTILEQRQEALRWQERELIFQQEEIANQIEDIRVQQNVLTWQHEALRKREELEQEEELREEEQRQEETQLITTLLEVLDLANNEPPLYNKLNLSEANFARRLRRHFMKPCALRKYGYPVPSYVEGCIDVHVHPRRRIDLLRLCTHEVDGFGQRFCVRCDSPFYVNESGKYLTIDNCVYHWGKFTNGQYTCCAGSRGSEGCTRNMVHVWNGFTAGPNGPYTDFLHTPSPSVKSAGGSKVYALDCEMCYTGRGLEVAKISLVGYDGQVVYDHFVRPTAEIVDYCTRFSGVKPSDLCQVHNRNLKTLVEVQQDLLQLIDADTILIGHSLENDLRVLRIVHKKVVDTAYEFPHPSGFPYRHSLKNLAKKYLKRDIQCSENGHDSVEDARASLDLVMWKVRNNIPPKRPCRRI